jgi:hypothetical protein
VGVLITPYATSPIAAPFLLFYGTMWAAFIYAFGYLIVWKMPKVAGGAESGGERPHAGGRQGASS